MESTRSPTHVAQHPNVKNLNHFGRHMAFCPTNKGGRHLTAEQLEPYRQIGDPHLDDLLGFMEEEGYPLKPQDDLLSPQQPYPQHIQSRIDEFVQYYSDYPDWVDQEQLERGQTVFLRYAGGISASLYHRSLVGGLSVPKIAKVLTTTAYLAPPSTTQQVGHRLEDTVALLASCTGFGVKHLLPNGDAWKTALYVRILHAKVRRQLLKREGPRGRAMDSDWDTEEYGVPINQEDMATTLLAFSIYALEGLEYVAGKPASQQEQEDYIALWRYLGWVMGVYTSHEDSAACAAVPSLTSSSSSSFSSLPRSLDPCGPGWYEEYPNPIMHARSISDSVWLHLVHPDETSTSIAHHLLRSGRGNSCPYQQKLEKKKQGSVSEANKPLESYDFYLRAQHCRDMIGGPLADALDLPHHPNPCTRLLIQIHGSMIWWGLRLFTWSGGLPFLKNGKHRLLVNTIQTFYSKWKRSHFTRMAKQIGKRENQVVAKERVCPFAFLAQP